MSEISNTPFKIKLEGPEGDHSHLIGELLEEVKPRKMIHQLILYAYSMGYENPSDGISFPIRWWAQLAFQDFNMKHPVGVMHDALYREGPLNPFVPKSLHGDETAVRRWMDARFGEGLWDFGNWGRAFTWEWGLRLFGYEAYHQYREREARGDYRHILNKAIIPIQGNAT